MYQIEIEKSNLWKAKNRSFKMKWKNFKINTAKVAKKKIKKSET